VRLWNAKTLTQKIPLEGHSGPIYGLSQSRRQPIGVRRLDRIIRIWDAKSGLLINPGKDTMAIFGELPIRPTAPSWRPAEHDGRRKTVERRVGPTLATYLGHKMAFTLWPSIKR